MSLATDIRDHVKSLFPSMDVFDETECETRQKTRGVLIQQRAVAPVPEPLLNIETVYADVTVREDCTGERGTALAYEEVQALYSALILVPSVTINGRDYVRIRADSAPYEVEGTQTFSSYRFGLEVIRQATEEGLTWL